MRLHECQQYSPEWWEARRGIPTASNFDKIVTSTGKPSSQQDAYIAELICDLYDPHYPRKETYQSAAMKNGTILEPQARSEFMLATGYDVDEVGFITTDDGRVGCSPDGLVGESAGLELKSPQLQTHLQYLMANKLPARYKLQVHGSMWVTGRTAWHFASYYPGMTLFMVKVEWDDFTGKIGEALTAFAHRLDEAKQQAYEASIATAEFPAYEPQDSEAYSSDPVELTDEERWHGNLEF